MGLGRRCILTILVAAAAAGCSGDDDAGDDTGPDQQPVLKVGDEGRSTCLAVDDALPAEVEELPVVDCSQEHSHEIFATVIYDERDVYPGVEELGNFALVECLERFEDFVGVSTFDSELTYTWLVPSLAGWNDEDDREVLCVLNDREGAPLTGSSAGAVD